MYIAEYMWIHTILGTLRLQIFLNNNPGKIVHCRDEHHTVILFCPHCGADLDEQSGFDPDAGYLICAECGQVLIDPEIDLNDSSRFGQVGWFCDGYCAFLNKQNSSSDWNSIWSCTECGYVNYP